MTATTPPPLGSGNRQRRMRDSMQFSAKIRDEVSSGDRTGLGIARSATVDTNNDDKRFELSWKHSDGS